MFIFISLIIFYILHNLFWNLGIISIYLDRFYNHAYVYNWILSNVKVTIPLLTWYLIFIGYISLNKWLSITKGLNWSYFQVLNLIYRALNFLLVPYVVYLFSKYNIFEWIMLIVISMFVSYFLTKVLNSYSSIRNDIKSLKLLNKYRKIKLEINDYNELFDNFSKWDFSNLKLLHFYYWFILPYITWISLVIAFLIFPIWYFSEFNLITCLYIHIFFIVIFIWMNLILNKFPWYMTIKYWKIIRSWYVLEDSKDKFILLTNKETIILDPSKIDYKSFETKHI